MAEKNGKLKTCDRCGCEVFLRAKGEVDADGGYTKWNNFEDSPGWKRVFLPGLSVDLCPACNDNFERMCRTFMGIPEEV